MKKVTFGVIVGNRGFFPDALAKEGRRDILSVLKEAGYGAVAISTKETKFGAVETFSDAKKCAALFAEKSDKIDGVIISLPNFGDERGAAEAVKRSGLNVPVLVHAEADNSTDMKMGSRRDSFCGKISVCNNLRQAAIPYTLTTNHTVGVKSKEFKKDLDDFAAVCRIIGGLKNVRFGAIGARTGAFNTVRYSEKLLELYGIGVETLDLSEVLGEVDKLKDTEAAVKRKLKAIKEYTTVKGIPEAPLMKMAKFGYVIDRWIKDNDIDGTAIQCWTALETYFGIVPCSLMSMMTEKLMPSACEVDITGENLQSRIRGNMLMALSNKFGWMVLATGNKSELAVGYSTIYGDMCGGFSPIKDCLKTRVYELSSYRNTISPAIPQAVIDRPPSAELAPGQLDQDSLPEYHLLDQILYYYIEHDWSIADIVNAGFDETVVRRVAAMVIKNEHKRRQSAPGVRITSRAFGRDRRYPITSGWHEESIRKT